MSTLRDSIQALAQTFATQVLEAIRGASLEDILAESAGKRAGRAPSAGRGGARASVADAASEGRLSRRSPDDIAAVSERIVALVKTKREGLRAEQIRAELGIAKNEWMRPLDLALASKKLTKKGEKRATTYFAK
jgi:hypothetical protein